MLAYLQYSLKLINMLATLFFGDGIECGMNLAERQGLQNTSMYFALRAISKKR